MVLTVETVQIQDMALVTLLSEDGVMLAIVVDHDAVSGLGLTHVPAVLSVGVEPQLEPSISINIVIIKQSFSSQ